MGNFLLKIVAYVMILGLPFSMKGQTDCDLLLTVNNKDQQITIDRQTHWTHSAGVGRIVVRVAEKNNSIDTLFMNHVGCSQYEIRMTPDSVKLAVYTTISEFDTSDRKWSYNYIHDFLVGTNE